MSRKVMIVEDDADILEQIKQLLELEGFETILATNGRKAIDVLKTNASSLPCCIILDIMMPEMDGLSFIKEIAAHYPEFSGIKILIASAKRSPVDPKSIPLSFERIQKPFDVDELMSAIEKCCR